MNFRKTKLMKPATSIIFFIIIALLSSITMVYADGQKRALLIAIGNYNKEVTGWNPISSANDVPLVKDALVSQGFKSENISVLVDEKAGYEAILQALDKLLADAQPNDVVLIHYSGHGQQITDDNNEEIDNFDEAMVPFDAHSRFQKGIYEGQKHIRDDEIGRRLTLLRQKVGVGGSVLLIMDSCHSGTASRGLAKTRGTQETFNTAPPKAGEAKAESGLFGLGDGAEKQTPMAPLVCFYGASAHELNYETKSSDGTGVGSLSLAFSDAFTNAKPTQTYAELFDQIKIKMSVLAPRQTPQAEGNLGNTILGGKIEGKKPYFLVTKVQNTSSAQINGGSLMGVYANSEITFYALGAEESEENKLAVGLVKTTDATTSEVELTWVKADAALKNAKAIVTKANFGSIAVSVKLDLNQPELEKSVKSEFAKYPLISLVSNYPDLLLEANNATAGDEKMHLITAQEYELLDEKYSDVATASKKITEKVLAYAQANYLRQVEMMNEDLNVVFEFIPITAIEVEPKKWQEQTRLTLKERTDTSGNIVFTDGDFFKLKVRNDGYEVAYYTILDFQPDNGVNVLVPGKTQNAADFVLKPGEEKELPKVFRISGPFGTEVFKLVASKEPIPFREILVDKGKSRAGGDPISNPFAELVSSSFRSEQTSRNAETKSVAPGNCNIFSVTFNIVAKK